MHFYRIFKRAHHSGGKAFWLRKEYHVFEFAFEFPTIAISLISDKSTLLSFILYTSYNLFYISTPHRTGLIYVKSKCP